MIDIVAHCDLDKVQQLWQRIGQPTCLFDHWQVRECFQKEYQRPAYIMEARQNGRFRGMLALSWIDESQNFGFFPGEVWKGNTWLEQNKLLADSREVAEALLEQVPDAARIRYLSPLPHVSSISNAGVDEIGFLFFPRQYHFSFANYAATFSSKSRKKIRHEIDALAAKGLTFRYNHLADIDLMYTMNLERFGGQSYFSDMRFLKSFDHMVGWLNANGMLRVTTVLIGGAAAAIDLSAIWNKTHTVLAGGTCREFPGVAKLINFHHLEWSCAQRIREVDFLCGDFNWKSRFHLTPRPLFEIRCLPAESSWRDLVPIPRTACAVG